jgi:ATP-binding cassette, subfamily B, bacterial
VSGATHLADDASPRAGRSATVYDLTPPMDRMAELRRVPRLAWDALRLVGRAGRTQLVATFALQVTAAVAIAGQLLISRELVNALIGVGGGAPVSDLYPWLAAVAGFTMLIGIVSALTTYEQKLLVELASRHAFDHIIDAAAGVDLEHFERPDYYDQLQRARNSGLYRLIDMVTSVIAISTGIITSIGIAVVLAVLQPLLLLFVALAAVFPLVATVRNSRAAYAFDYAMTPESRERQYLMELLTEREPAKEIRMFGAAPFLRARYRELTDERVRRLRAFLRNG